MLPGFRFGRLVKDSIRDLIEISIERERERAKCTAKKSSKGKNEAVYLIESRNIFLGDLD